MHYVGKDVVHEGAGLRLDPESLEQDLARSARKNVRKAQRFGFEIERREGTEEELSALRRLWYLPEDPNFPDELGERDVLYMAFLDGELVGGMVLVPVGSHLFLNNLLADERGKAGQLQGLLLWHAVHDLAGGEYAYIDVGVSYRPNLQRFFQKWASFRYPVIFHPPELTPHLGMRPFTRLVEPPDVVDEEGLLAFAAGRPFTLLPSRDVALEVLGERGESFRETALPTAGEGVELVDLTRALPIQHGALVAGLELSPQELWDRHGCYDFVKTEWLRRAVGQAGGRLEELCERRLSVWARLSELFAREDVEIGEPGRFPLALELRCDAAPPLAERYRSFGVEAEAERGVLRLPCHQELTEAEITYLYAIYRGHLNLCSEWAPTRVRGRLKALA